MIIRMGIRMLEGSFTFSSFGKESVQVCRCLTAVVCVCGVTQVARRAGGQPTVARWPSSRSRSGRWWRCTGVRRSARGGARSVAMMAVWTSLKPAFLSTPRSWDSKGDGKAHTVLYARTHTHRHVSCAWLTIHKTEHIDPGVFLYSLIAIETGSPLHISSHYRTRWKEIKEKWEKGGRNAEDECLALILGTHSVCLSWFDLIFFFSWRIFPLKL